MCMCMCKHTVAVGRFRVTKCFLGSSLAKEGRERERRDSYLIRMASSFGVQRGLYGYVENTNCSGCEPAL